MAPPTAPQDAPRAAWRRSQTHDSAALGAKRAENDGKLTEGSSLSLAVGSGPRGGATARQQHHACSALSAPFNSFHAATPAKTTSANTLRAEPSILRIRPIHLKHAQPPTPQVQPCNCSTSTPHHNLDRRSSLFPSSPTAHRALSGGIVTAAADSTAFHAEALRAERKQLCGCTGQETRPLDFSWGKRS
ncbi:hypothetical protein FALBO_13394 [Fusarium albosuccineum]|uniref:Uncharacterized protein n=1 Tax=Fusarium albosuccineum TaxID=1237068 RepID=A0A8H4L042_9HYPO|nr:hypothetical protein FALBO_13394 [Fusarium albosuccineum]